MHIAVLAFITVVIASFAKTFFSWFFRIRLHKKALSNVNSEPTHWFWGHLGKENIPDEKFVRRMLLPIDKYPKVRTRWFGFIRAVLTVYYPSLVKEIISSDEPKDKFVYGTLKSWIGDGLLISKGAKWKRNRRLLTPAFHFDMLKKYLIIFNETVNTMCTKWSNQTTVKAFHNVSLMTLDSMLQCAMSSKTDCQNVSLSHPYISAVYEMSETSTTRFFNPIYISDFIFYNLTSAGAKFKKACKIAHEFSENEIDKRKKLYSTNPEQKRKDQMDFLDMLLLAKDENGKGLTDIEIRNEVDTFLFEGHDTTASGISWALYNLAIHPEYQEKCREEIIRILGEREVVENADLNQMTYLTMCIKESLRLYPPVSAITRSLSKPFRFSSGFGSDQTTLNGKQKENSNSSKTFPASLPVSVRILELHRNKYVWEDPEVFDPDRFLQENIAKRSPFAFVPFSAGPRNCIGQNFAMMEMKVALALCFKKFRFSLDENFPKPEIYLAIITKAKNDIHLKVENIK